MEFIDLSHAARTETAGHSSKGNQLKWRQGDNWYKADQMGYEGLAEIIISHFLKQSGVELCVVYEPVEIRYKGALYHGCVSHNFLKEEERLVTLEGLMRLYTGRSLAQELARIQQVKERILYLVENVREITGLKEFGPYLAAALEIDALFLNEDRHTNNLAVIYNEDTGKYRLCPYFDHGLSLYSDTREDFPLALSLDECRKKICAKPFSRDFDEQLDAAEELYGKQIHFRFDERLAEQELKKLDNTYESGILSRAGEVLRQQKRKYQYLFS